LRTGAPWRDLPTAFGRWKSVYDRLRAWTKNGLWKAIWLGLSAAHRDDESLMCELLTNSPVATAALDHAGGLKDTPAGRAKYLDYLAWLAEDEPARKEQRFAEMSTGWVIGREGFAKSAVQAHAATLGQGRRMAEETRVTQEAVWQETLAGLLAKAGRAEGERASEGKSAEWKLALAAALKAQTTVTNRWLGEALHLGNLHEVSRKVAAWTRGPAVARGKRSIKST
jgi:transposase